GGNYPRSFVLKRLPPKDTTPPVTTDSGIDGEWHNQSVTVLLKAQDNISGVGKTYYSLDGSTPKIVYQGKIVVSQEGAYTLRYYSQDKAGNVERIKTASKQIKIDKTPPQGSIRINNIPSGCTNNPQISLTLSAKDTDGSGLSQMQFYNQGDISPNPAGDSLWTTPESYNISKSLILPVGDGQKKFFVRFKDAAGNWSNVISGSISLDTVPPQIPIVTIPLSTYSSSIIIIGSKETGSSVLIDGVEIIPPDLSSEWSYAMSLKPGDNVLKISAKDLAGNESESRNFTIKYLSFLSTSVIQTKIDALTEGGIVKVDPGMYVGNIRLKAGVFLVSKDAKDTIITGRVASEYLAVIEAEGNTQINGFTITGGSNGIYVNNQPNGSVIITNNIINGSLGSGIYAENTGSVIIKNNLIVKHAYSGLDIRNCQWVDITNNTVDGNGDNAVYYLPASVKCNIVNNIFSNNDSFGVYPVSTGLTPEKISCNDFWNNGRGAYSCYQPDATNIEVDPLFVDRANNQYYLSQIQSGQSGNSLCVDAGEDSIYSVISLSHRATRSDGVSDNSLMPVDLGFHYSSSETIRENRAPVIDSIGEKAIAPEQLLQFRVNGFDPDEDNLVFSIENIPPGATFDPVTNVFSWHPTVSQRGLWNFTLKASDGQLVSIAEGKIIVDFSVTTQSKLDFEVYPTIFLHGHSSCPEDFEYLLNKSKVDNMLVVSPVYAGDDLGIGTYPRGSLFNAGYYKESKTSTATHDYHGRIGGCPASKNSSVEYNTRVEYAKQLRRIVENVCLATGSDKVNIVAHSMGGLVARAYIRWLGGENRVNKFLLIATPNHGISETDALALITSGFSIPAGISWMENGEIAEMNAADSSWGGYSYTKWLNEGDESYNKVQYATIAGDYNPLGRVGHHDGLVNTENVYLNFAKFNAVTYAAHSDGVAKGELSLVSCTYTAEVIKRWLFQDKIERGSRLSIFPNYPLPIRPVSHLSEKRQSFDYSLDNSNAVCMQIIMCNYLGINIVDLFAFPTYSGIHYNIRDFTDNELISKNRPYYYYVCLYDMDGIVGEKQRMHAALIDGTGENIPLPPNTSITDVKVVDDQANFTYTSDTGTEFSYKMDNGDWSAWSTKKTYTSGHLNLWSHIFWVKSRIPPYYDDSTPASNLFFIKSPLNIVTISKEIGMSISMPIQQELLVITDNVTWQRVWTGYMGSSDLAPTLPAIDFSKEMVIAVFMGQKPTSGYSISITKIEEYPDKLRVYVYEEKPNFEIGQVVSEVLTFPYHIVKLNKFTLPVEFVFQDE
ncbi:MAG: alpha/beta fold hydrolase, partial [Candidatus Omnitrophota bacterium]